MTTVLRITKLKIDAHIVHPGSRGGHIIGYRKGEPIYGTIESKRLSHAKGRLSAIHVGDPSKMGDEINARTNRTRSGLKLAAWHHVLKGAGHHEHAEVAHLKLRGLNVKVGGEKVKKFTKGSKDKRSISAMWSNPNSTFHESVKHIKEMGVSVSIHGEFNDRSALHMRTVRAVRGALLTAYKSESPMPTYLKLYMTREEVQNAGHHSRVGGWFNAGPQSISVNMDASFQGPSDSNVSFTPEAIMHHEMGHLQHLMSFPREKGEGLIAQINPFNAMEKGSFRDEHSESQVSAIIRGVSSYATTNKLEFVAEVHTGLRLGKGFSKIITDLFEDYTGQSVEQWTKNWSK